MTKKTLIWISSLFVGLCIWQIATALLNTDRRSGVTLLQQTMTQEAPVADVNAPAAQPAPVVQIDTSLQFGASGGAQETVFLGDAGEDAPYKYELEFDTRGAAIRTARFSEYDDRDPKDPQPLAILTPAGNGPDQEVLSLANSYFMLHNHGQQLNLGQLNWQAGKQSRDELGQQSIAFTATITHSGDQPALRLTKTYTIRPNDYIMDCTLQVENLMNLVETASFNLYGPCGLDKEGFRSDNRQVVAAYRNDQGTITSSRIDMGGLNKALKKNDTKKRTLTSKHNDTSLLWVATVNKYFAGLIIPVSESLEPDSQWMGPQRAVRFDADGDSRTQDDYNIGLYLESKSFNLGVAGAPDSTQTFRTQIYLGPKDKEMFDKNERYSALGFKETINFRSCCCFPDSIINPLAFLILKIMSGIHAVTHNYGVAIIILVAVMRALLHPVTKKSQVSMHKMSKLAPRAEEIKKKYANNKAEMQKQLMELYREQGASPITGMLPMFIQMPIWIALWSAVNSSIALRGASFLPFWITDLSAPDALIRWPAITIPLLQWKLESLNLLPILMGVAFYLQQKLMPTQTQAATNPQMAQQQKMMMIMMPIMFPLMFYKTASGVNLYIMTSTFAGVIEQKIIRKHIKEREKEEGKGLVAVTSKTGGKVKKRKPKPMFKDH